MDHIWTTVTSPIPGFNLIIRYAEVRYEEQKPKGLAKIRYEPAVTGSHSTSDSQSVEPTPAMELESLFNRRAAGNLHRHTWICAADPSFARPTATHDVKMLRRLRREYEELHVKPEETQ
jgi:hypothetical protein